MTLPASITDPIEAAIADASEQGIAQGRADQQTLDAPTIDGLQTALAARTRERDEAQAALVAYEATHHTPDPVTPPPPPPPAAALRFGTYMGQFAAASVKSAVGNVPAFSTYYYQTSGSTPAALQVAKHQAELDQGITQVIDLDWKASSMTIAQVAAGKADAALTTWLKDLKTLSDYAKAKGTEVWFSFVHEAVVHINGNKFAAGAVSITDMAAAWNHVMDLAKAQAPNARRTYWFGGMEKKVGGEVQGVVFGDSLNPDHIQAVSFDPYLFPSHSDTETAAGTFGGVITSLQKRSWFKGKPWGLTEYGASTDHGDAAMAAWISSVATLLKANGASIAVYFDRNTDNDYRITEGATPKALAAYKAAVTS